MEHFILDPSSAAARVARGATLLDNYQPGWHNNITLDNLDMDKVAKCILGQLFGNYWDGMSNLFPGTSKYSEEQNDKARDHAFNDNAAGGNKMLATAWKELIRARKSPVDLTRTLGDFRYTLVEAIGLGKQVRAGDVGALAELLFIASGADPEVFKAIFD